MRNIRRSFCLLLASLALVAGVFAADSAKRPNVLIIMADDLGFADLGFQGSKDIVTPHIDALARQSVNVAQAYISAPVCMPSRMGMLMGRYQQRFGMQTLGNDAIGVPDSEVNLAQMLRQNGYVTGIIGKWHLGAQPEFRPNVRGFDEFYGFLNGNTPYYPGTGKFWRNNTEIEKPAYLTDGFGEEAISFINRHATQPFFLYLAFNAVHTPMQAPATYLQRFAHIKDEGRRIYAAMAAAMDDNIGRVLATLREKGLEENTLIFFLSDNGGAPQNYSENAPLRSGKYEVYEGGIRTPFLFQWKAGGVKPRAENKTVITALDILPTILAATNAKVELKQPLDGVNLLPFLQGKEKTVASDRRLFWRYGPYMCAMRSGDWKILQCGFGSNKNPAWELYNVVTDVSEAHDLAAAQPEKLKQMIAEFQAWDKTLPPATVMDKRLLEGTVWWKTRASLTDTKD